MIERSKNEKGKERIKQKITNSKKIETERKKQKMI